MKRLSMLVMVVLLVSGVALAQWPEENHYKVYNLMPPQPYARVVQLADQFGGYTVDMLSLEKFANPVHKNGEPIIFPETHHTWWAVDLAGSGWIIEADNQFGPQVLHVGDPRYLVLPARKYEDGPPLQNNHYLAYEATGEPIMRTVNLADQFGVVDVVVLEPVLFLNPVEKMVDGVVHPIVDPEAHLTCYRIDPPMPYQIMVLAFDQFGVWEFEVVGHELLCVPSWKFDVVSTEQRSWSDIKELYR